MFKNMAKKKPTLVIPVYIIFSIQFPILFVLNINFSAKNGLCLKWGLKKKIPKL